MSRHDVVVRLAVGAQKGFLSEMTDDVTRAEVLDSGLTFFFHVMEACKKLGASSDELRIAIHYLLLQCGDEKKVQ